MDYLCVRFGDCSLSHFGRRAYNMFSTFWPCDLSLWPIDLIFIGRRVSWWTIPVQSLVVVLSAVLVLSCEQTRTYRHTDAAKRLTQHSRGTALPQRSAECNVIKGLTLYTMSPDQILFGLVTLYTTSDFAVGILVSDKTFRYRGWMRDEATSSDTWDDLVIKWMLSILPRDAVQTRCVLRQLCLSVCPSVTLVLCRNIWSNVIHYYSSHVIRIFLHQKSWRNSDGTVLHTCIHTYIHTYIHPNYR